MGRCILSYPQSTPIGLLFELHTRISIEQEAERIVYVLCDIVWGCQIDDGRSTQLA